MLNDTDARLWRRAADGDAEAFAELYRRHSQRLYNYLFRRLGNWSEAEDLVAAVFLEAYRRRRDPAVVDEKIVAWLFGIATNLAHNRRRSIWRGRRLLARAEAVVSQAAPEPDAAARAEAAEQMAQLRARVRALPIEQQDVIALCVWTGLSYEEAAEALRVPVGTVRSRLSRARAVLAELEGRPRHEAGESNAGEVIP